MAMPAIVRLILRSFAALGIALAALIAILVAINAFDEELSPEIVDLLKPAPRPDVRDEDNGYYVLMGLDAPTGVDPHAFGRQQVEKRIEEDKRFQKMTGAERLREAERKWQQAAAQMGRMQPDRKEIKPGDRKYLCGARPCLEHVKRNLAEVKRVLDENRELLDRYQLLLEYPRLVATYVPLTSISEGSYPLGGTTFQRLWITRVAFEFDKGNLQAAFTALERDVAFQRALLKGAPQYYEAIRPLFGLRDDVALLVEMVVARPAAAQQFNDQIEAMLAPLTSEELSWTRFRKTEMTKAVNLMLDDPATVAEWLQSPFFKRNATVNGLYAARKLIYEWNEFSASQHEAMRQRIAQADQKLQFPSWTFAYNPLGKWALSGTDFNPYIEYFEGYYDFDGLRRLVALAARIAPRAQGDIPSLIEKSGTPLSDPYTGKPMNWDAERKQVYFEPRSKWSREHKNPIGGVQGRIGIRVLP